MAQEEQWRRGKEDHERKLALAVFVAAGGDVSRLRTVKSFNPSSDDQIQAQADNDALPSLLANIRLIKAQPQGVHTGFKNRDRAEQ